MFQCVGEYFLANFVGLDKKKQTKDLIHLNEYIHAYI